jgi:hypothetical protein
MSKSVIKDTAAYRIIKQMVTHSWDADKELNSQDVVDISKMFVSNGGSWKNLIDGDIHAIELLENSIGIWASGVDLSKIAKRIGNV